MQALVEKLEETSTRASRPVMYLTITAVHFNLFLMLGGEQEEPPNLFRHTFFWKNLKMGKAANSWVLVLPLLMYVQTVTGEGHPPSNISLEWF